MRRVPFTGESAIAVGFKQIKDDPQPPHELNPQIPSEVERIILKALEKNPLMRHRTVTELKQELERAILPAAPVSQVESGIRPQASEPVQN